MELLVLLLDKFLPERWKTKSLSPGRVFVVLGGFCTFIFLTTIAALGTTLTVRSEIVEKSGVLTNVSIKKMASFNNEHRTEYFLVYFGLNSVDPKYLYRFDDRIEDCSYFKDGDSALISYKSTKALLAQGYKVYQVDFKNKRVGSLEDGIKSEMNIRTILFLVAVVTGLGSFYLFKARFKFIDGERKKMEDGVRRFEY